ncbi:MAG: CapA family protein [Pseudobdellovibrio sp.]
MIRILCRKALVIKIRAFFVLLMLCSGCQISHVRNHAPDINKIKPQPVPKPIVQAEYIISFVGDVILHERLRKREEATQEGYQKIWSEMQPYIDASDISYANLEGPVAPEYGGVTGFPMFNYPEKIISALKNNGVDIVSTANNHALDRQAKGIKKTIQNLKKYNLAYTGTISGESTQSEVETWWGLTPLKNTKLSLAWIACTEMTNGNHDKEHLVLYCYKDKEKIKELIIQLRAMPNVAGIILTPHWGEEEKFEIEAGRRLWAHTMINLGALAIVGSHPHVVQKIENYIAEDGRQSFIAYSLGNFVSNQPWVPNKASMVLFSKMKLNTYEKLELVDIKYIPLWMNRTIDKDYTSKFRLEPVWDYTKKPSEAVRIWGQQLGETYRIKSLFEADLYFKARKK